MLSPRTLLLPEASLRQHNVDALDGKAVEGHLNTVVQSAGGVDISFSAIGPRPAPHRKPLTELVADAFARAIAFYTGSNFITATAAVRP